MEPVFNLQTALRSASEKSSTFENYRRLLTDIARLAGDAGYPTEAFNRTRPSKFRELPHDQQTSIINGLNTFHDICASAVENGVDLYHNGLGLAWWAIKSLKLRPSSDVFSHLRQNDIVEIYDQNHVQIFRSFEFLKCVSYSLDEVFTHSWWELYERDQAVTDSMMQVAKSMIESHEPITLLAPFETHLTKERFSSRLRVSRSESRLVSTLVDSHGTPRAYINAFSLVSV